MGEELPGGVKSLTFFTGLLRMRLMIILLITTRMIQAPLFIYVYEDPTDSSPFPPSYQVWYRTCFNLL